MTLLRQWSAKKKKSSSTSESVIDEPSALSVPSRTLAACKPPRPNRAKWNHLGEIKRQHYRLYLCSLSLMKHSYADGSQVVWRSTNSCNIIRTSGMEYFIPAVFLALSKILGVEVTISGQWFTAQWYKPSHLLFRESKPKEGDKRESRWCLCQSLQYCVSNSDGIAKHAKTTEEKNAVPSCTYYAFKHFVQNLK